MRILKSIWLFVDVSEGFVVVFEGFVLLMGELLHSSIPLLLDFVKGLVDLSFDSSLFLVIFPLDEEEVVGEVRGEGGFFVLNPLCYGIRTGSGGGEGDSCFMGVFGRDGHVLLVYGAWFG